MLAVIKKVYRIYSVGTYANYYMDTHNKYYYNTYKERRIYLIGIAHNLEI